MCQLELICPKCSEPENVKTACSIDPAFEIIFIPKNMSWNTGKWRASAEGFQSLNPEERFRVADKSVPAAHSDLLYLAVSACVRGWGTRALGPVLI